MIQLSMCVSTVDLAIWVETDRSLEKKYQSSIKIAPSSSRIITSSLEPLEALDFFGLGSSSPRASERDLLVPAPLLAPFLADPLPLPLPLAVTAGEGPWPFT